MKAKPKIPGGNFGAKVSHWEEAAKTVVLLRLLDWEPDPREFLVIDDLDLDSDDFTAIWKGTMEALVGDGLIREVRQLQPNVYNKYELTNAGMELARKRFDTAKR